MIFLFQGINTILILLILTVPVLATYYLINHLRNKEENKDEILGRLIILEKKVKELEDYISDSDM
ncbi:hypothetical protein CLOTH_07290 [Alkalithermobacter paradoxus]|uniref:Phage shock protein B n=1 Tax=Alkalithermobacter paradoxus TaxID=29349 RepID=A0A1V4I9N1_9FIRM|nr:hypothetical protein CLOTH_07290 [[Clostridium] thermoalcaliphilum]